MISIASSQNHEDSQEIVIFINSSQEDENLEEILVPSFDAVASDGIENEEV